jgi:dihydrofolate synthase / folylpolyglutamate synthase
MRYSEAVDYLYKLQKFGAQLGLERTFKLAALAGNPQERLRFIHVAGTNGKGSTCAMLESIYRHSGYKVGLFTSPHLVSFAERIQVNRQLIPEQDVARLTEEIRGYIEQIGPCTLFEAVTVMALRWFDERKVDLVIWETGLGGRLDSTNIVTPVASVITNIQRDHERWLGHTLAEIAREKAGIIKRGVPVFTGVETDEAFEVIKSTADRLSAPLHRTEASKCFRSSLLGPHQEQNAALAISVARGLSLPIESDLTNAFRNISWPGRFDIRGRYILDGAHNPDGARALRLSIESLFPGVKPTFIVGILADKDIVGIARELVVVASQIFTVSVQSDRAADSESLAQQFREVNSNVPVEACTSLAAALEKSEGDDRVVITGSLHFIGEAMERLGLQAGALNERGLNDWTSSKQ